MQQTELTYEEHLAALNRRKFKCSAQTFETICKDLDSLNAKLSEDNKIRLGQYFLNAFPELSPYPELFYEKDYEKAKNMIIEEFVIQ
jgi:hypothetical protein